jgi:hypothetical protein
MILGGTRRDAQVRKIGGQRVAREKQSLFNRDGNLPHLADAAGGSPSGAGEEHFASAFSAIRNKIRPEPLKRFGTKIAKIGHGQPIEPSADPLGNERRGY